MRARRTAVELLLANHPSDCLACQRSPHAFAYPPRSICLSHFRFAWAQHNCRVSSFQLS